MTLLVCLVVFSTSTVELTNIIVDQHHVGELHSVQRPQMKRATNGRSPDAGGSLWQDDVLKCNSLVEWHFEV
jgi:hypothetical protein